MGFLLYRVWRGGTRRKKVHEMNIMVLKGDPVGFLLCRAMAWPGPP